MNAPSFAPTKTTAIPNPQRASVAKAAPSRLAVPAAKTVLSMAAPAVLLGSGTTGSLKSSGTSELTRFLASPGPGEPLPSAIRDVLESKMEVPLHPVRVHTDKRTNAVVDATGARAFTYGLDICFGSGERVSDVELLAHEVAHVVQQQGRPVVQMSGPAAASDPFEAEARQTSASIKNGNQATVALRTGEARVQGVWPIDDIANWAENKGWDLVEHYAPELVPILKKGPFEYIKESLLSAVENVFNTFMAPIRSLTGIADALKGHFSNLLVWMRDAAGKIARGDCKPLADAVEKVQQVIEGIAAPVLDKIKNMAGKVKDFFTGLWDRFGAPVWEFLKKIGGAAWEKIQQLGTWIWDKTAPIRKTIGKAWTWVKNKLGIGEGPEGQDGILQWIQRKAQGIWDDHIKPFIERHKKPLMVVGGILLMLSPAGPIIAIGAAAAGLIYAFGWVRKHMRNTDAIPDQRNVFQRTIIPGIQKAAGAITGVLKKATVFITGKLNDVLGGLGGAVSAVAGSILSFIAKAIQWIADRFSELLTWANETLTRFSDMVSEGLKKLGTFLEPIAAFLGKVAEVYINIISLPLLILGELWKKIPACIRNPFVDFLIERILKRVPLFKTIIETVPTAWAKLKTTAMKVLRLVFKNGDLAGAALEIFKLLLDALNVPVELIQTIFAKAGAALDAIVDKPVVFLTNLLSAMKQGFVQFGKNILGHLASGVANWLLSAAADAELHPPTELSFKAIFYFILEVLDITVQKVLDRIEKKMGKEVANKIRAVVNTVSKIWNWLSDLLSEGPDGVWNRLKEKVGDLWGAVLDGAIGYIVEKVVNKAIEKVIMSLDPTGIMAVVNGLIALYKAVQSAIQYAKRILEIVNSVLDTITDIINGAIGSAADLMEKVMDRALSIVIGFLANQVGLGDIGKRLGEVIQKIRDKVTEGIDWLIDKVIKLGKGLLNFGKAVVGKITEWWKKKIKVGEKDEKHSLSFEGDEESSTLVIESQKTLLERFLEDAQKRYKTEEKQKAIKEAKDKVDEIKKLRDKIRQAKKDNKPEKADEHRRTLINLFDTIGTILNVVFKADRKLHTGMSKDDAIPLTWYKLTGDYPPIKLQLKSGEEKQTVNINDYVILPVSRKKIGVDKDNMPQKDTIWQRGVVVRTGIEDEFKMELKSVGYDLDAKGEDPDHVRDLAFGGMNRFTNLWPLSISINRSAFQWYQNYKIKYLDEKRAEKEAPLLHLSGRWFKIKDFSHGIPSDPGGTD